MNENEKWKLSKESDCPKCFETQPYHWNAEINGSWACKCGKNKMPKITKEILDKISRKVGFCDNKKKVLSRN